MKSRTKRQQSRAKLRARRKAGQGSPGGASRYALKKEYCRAQTADNLRLAVDEHRAHLARNAERSILVGSFERVVDLMTALVLAHQTEAEKSKNALANLQEVPIPDPRQIKGGV